MKTATIPANEEARLTALRSYDLLDTEPEAWFDGLTKLASALLSVPIVLVSLVDRDRQWFKSRHGLAASETSRDVSFCAHVVAEGAPLVVPASARDPRFSDNPLVDHEPFVRFYAGVPLRTSDGHVLGTLCAIDHQPRDFSAEQLGLLELLAGQVMERFELRRARRVLVDVRARDERVFARSEALMRASEEAVLVYDAHGRVLQMNPAAERAFNLDSRDLPGANEKLESLAWAWVRRDGSPLVPESMPWNCALSSGEAFGPAVVGFRREKELAWFDLRVLPLRNAGSSIPVEYLAVYRDVTVLESTRVEREKQARLVTTGALAAGIGHEINNPLAAILASLDLTLEDLAETDATTFEGKKSELVKSLSEARDGSERITKIVRGLRALVSGTSGLAPVEVGTALDLALDMTTHELRARAMVERNLPPLPLVLADETRLAQVFVHLLLAAAKSFRSNDLERNRLVVDGELTEDGRVSVTVRWSLGAGLDIDDPLQAARNGQGLGLSICQHIVDDLGGDLTFEREAFSQSLRSGAALRLVLPRGAAPAPAGPSITVRRDGTRGRVLVVDDEPTLVGIVARSLGAEHEVVGIVDPREALARLCAGETFDVVFCDLTMPFVSGQTLHRAVRAIDPAQADRFVFVTGGAVDPSVQAFLAEVPNERVDKPFSVQNLRAIARRFVAVQASK